MPQSLNTEAGTMHHLLAPQPSFALHLFLVASPQCPLPRTASFFRVGASHSDRHHDVIRVNQDYHSGYDIYRFAFYLFIFFFSLIFLISLYLLIFVPLLNCLSTPPLFIHLSLFSFTSHLCFSSQWQ